MKRTRTQLPASHSTAGQTSCSVSIELGHTGVSRWSVMNIHRIYCSCRDLSTYFYIFPVAFRLYDLDRDDKISRDELLQVSGLVCHGNMMLNHCALCRNYWFMQLVKQANHENFISKMSQQMNKCCCAISMSKSCTERDFHVDDRTLPLCW